MRTGFARLRFPRLIPLHPLALAAVPLLVLYTRNVKEGISVGDLLGPMGVVLGATAATMALLSLILRSVRRGALVATGLVTLFFAFGPLTDALGAGTLAQAGVLVASAVLAIAAGVAVARAATPTIV